MNRIMTALAGVGIGLLLARRLRPALKTWCRRAFWDLHEACHRVGPAERTKARP